jgi:hypothetical protein
VGSAASIQLLQQVLLYFRQHMVTYDGIPESYMALVQMPECAATNSSSSSSSSSSRSSGTLLN